MRSFELKATTQKSYYKKAFVIQDEHNNIYLQSYNTIVCGIINGSFLRFWGNYSVTTLNHINDFCRLYNIPTMNKKAWTSKEVMKCDFYYKEVANMGNQNYWSW